MGGSKRLLAQAYPVEICIQQFTIGAKQPLKGDKRDAYLPMHELRSGAKLPSGMKGCDESDP